MSLFPDIDVAGHGARNGLDPDGGALQKVIAKNMFQEADRGAPFRSKLASILERTRSPIPMPRLRPDDPCSPRRYGASSRVPVRPDEGHPTECLFASCPKTGSLFAPMKVGDQTRHVSG